MPYFFFWLRNAPLTKLMACPLDDHQLIPIINTNEMSLVVQHLSSLKYKAEVQSASANKNANVVSAF